MSVERDQKICELLGLDLVRSETLPDGPYIDPGDVGKTGPWFGRVRPDGSVMGWELSEGAPFASGAVLNEIGWPKVAEMLLTRCLRGP